MHVQLLLCLNPKIKTVLSAFIGMWPLLTLNSWSNSVTIKLYILLCPYTTFHRKTRLTIQMCLTNFLRFPRCYCLYAISLYSFSFMFTYKDQGNQRTLRLSFSDVKSTHSKYFMLL